MVSAVCGVMMQRVAGLGVQAQACLGQLDRVYVVGRTARSTRSPRAGGSVSGSGSGSAPAARLAQSAVATCHSRSGSACPVPRQAGQARTAQRPLLSRRAAWRSVGYGRRRGTPGRTLCPGRAGLQERRRAAGAGKRGSSARQARRRSVMRPARRHGGHRIRPHLGNLSWGIGRAAVSVALPGAGAVGALWVVQGRASGRPEGQGKGRGSRRRTLGYGQGARGVLHTSRRLVGSDWLGETVERPSRAGR